MKSLIILAKTSFRSGFLAPYKKFIKYSLVGVTGLSIDLTLMILLVEYYAWSPQSAATLSFALSASNNFIWHKRWTFRDENRNYLRQYGQFLLAAICGLGINYFIMGALLNCQIHYVVARLIAIAVIVFWNFIINSLWTFRPMKTDLSTDQ